MSKHHASILADLANTYFNNENDVNIHTLSLDICTEFKKIVEEFGEASFFTLGSLVAKAMDTLFDVFRQRDKIIGELDRLEHDHALLITKHEAEKTELKIFSERTLDLEDALQEKQKIIENLKSSASSAKKLLEMKIKNATDHILRLEERDNELQSTYTNLRQRYGELFRAYVELTERLGVSADDDPNVPTSSTKSKCQSTEFEPCSSTTTAAGVNPLLLVSHKGDSPYEWGIQSRKGTDSVNPLPDFNLDVDGSPFSRLSVDETYEDSSNSEAESDSGDSPAASPLPPYPKESTTGFNASKEVSKLVNDFNELEKTNNALKVVINDLLTKTEELNGEKLELKETLSQMQLARSSMQLHIKHLEEDNTRLKNELGSALDAQKQSLMKETNFSKRMNFTREEMAKVLMDRIQLQEDVSDLREKLSNILGESRNSKTQGPMAGNNPFKAFFARLFQRHSRRFSPTVSFDPSTSGISVDLNNSRSLESETSGLTSDRNRLTLDLPFSRDAVKVAVCNNSWWIPLPFTAKPCEPEPVVMQNVAALRRTSETSKSILPSCPPLPWHLYRRPIPEALSEQMQLICATCLFLDIGGMLPSGEVLAGRSTFFSPTALDSALSSATNYTGDNLSNQLWLCLVGAVETTTVVATNDGSADAPSAVEFRPALHSQVVVVDASKPSRYVDSFCLKHSVITCMAAIPGAKKRDYEVLRLSNTTWESIPFVNGGSATPSADNSQATTSKPEDTEKVEVDVECEEEDCPASIQTNNTLFSLQHFVATVGKIGDDELLLKALQNQQQSSMLSSSITGTSQRSSAFEPDIPLAGRPGDFYRVERQSFKKVSSLATSAIEDPAATSALAASAQQTVWLGCQNGDVFVHSCDSSQRRPLQSTRLPSGVTAICHFSGRVFIALGDGNIVVFRRQVHHSGHRSQPLPKSSSPPVEDHVSSTQSSRNELSIQEELLAAGAMGVWDFTEAVVISCAPTSQFAVKALAVVPPALTVWAACRNRIIVIDATTFQRLYAIEVVPKSNSIVRNMCWTRDGVWTSLRLDPILRLFNAFTYEPMQELDMAYILSATIEVPDFQPLSALAAISALGASPDHLWVGTNGGYIVCMPFKQGPSTAAITDTANSSYSSSLNNLTVSSDHGENVSPPSAQVQLSGVSVSGYGNSEAVNFFSLANANSTSASGPLPVSSTPSKPAKLDPSASTFGGLLMISGGVGFVEHRQRVVTHGAEREKRRNKQQSHLLVWSIPHEDSKIVSSDLNDISSLK